MAGGPSLDEELVARLARLEKSYEALEDALERIDAPRPAPPSPSPLVEPAYDSVQAWVGEWFAPIFGRRLGAVHWCAQWWRHDEASFRLEALWRSWEMARYDGGLGMALWLRDHLDTQLRVLFSGDGPFQACDGDSHNPAPGLPVASPSAESGSDGP